MENLKREYTDDKTDVQPIRSCSGDPYQFWGLFDAVSNWCVPPRRARCSCLERTDLGAIFFRIIYGARISLTIGLVGIAISFIVGLTLGGLAGYYGGWVDNIVQRMIEIIRSFLSFR